MAKLAGFVALLVLVRGSPLALALWQGFLFADFSSWLLILGLDLAARKSLGPVEGIGYVFLFWLFHWLGTGQWLPGDPRLVGLAFLSFLVVFLVKVSWWRHRNLGFGSTS